MKKGDFVQYVDSQMMAVIFILKQICAVVVTSCSLGFAATPATQSQVLSIPEKDKIQIETFLSYLICRENLGFVLFGNTKPGCSISIPLTHKKALLPIKNALLPTKIQSPLRYQRDLRQSWDKWRYYQHRFSHPRFIICEEFQSIEGGMYLQLTILDKERLKQTLERHRNIFAEILGEQFCVEKFISKVENKKKLRPLIKRNHKLLGLILGFDLDSCAAFQERFEGKEVQNPMKRLSSRVKGSLIVPVSFVGDPESEATRKLIQAYREEIPMIEEILNSESFLTQCLESLQAS